MVRQGAMKLERPYDGRHIIMAVEHFGREKGTCCKNGRNKDNDEIESNDYIFSVLFHNEKTFLNGRSGVYTEPVFKDFRQTFFFIENKYIRFGPVFDDSSFILQAQ